MNRRMWLWSAWLLTLGLLVGSEPAVARGPHCLETALCIRDFHWSPTACACVPNGSCSTDRDCRLFSDYCTGCDCVALSLEDADPLCDGPGVRCFADPCDDSFPLCVDGQCVVGPCVDTQLCIRGFRWSPERCMCVPGRARAPHPVHLPHAPHSPRSPHSPHAPRHP